MSSASRYAKYPFDHRPTSWSSPFVYLTAFEGAARELRTDVTPATTVNDEQTTFTFEDKEWTPGNYEDEYDGVITLRRALAHSRNVATVKVAQMTGYDKIANLWKLLGAATVPKPYPSITLGVFEATPVEVQVDLRKARQWLAGVSPRAAHINAEPPVAPGQVAGTGRDGCVGATRCAA